MHAEESSKSFSQIMEERAKFKELKEKLGRDSIQNPTINYFDDRPGTYIHIFYHAHAVYLTIYKHTNILYNNFLQQQLQVLSSIKKKLVMLHILKSAKRKLMKEHLIVIKVYV